MSARQQAAEAEQTPPGYISVADAEALISAKVSEATTAMLGLLQRNAPEADYSRQLAMAIAELSDQGSGRKRVSPAEMAKREDAYREMLTLLHFNAEKNIPLAYQLKRKVILEDARAGPFLIEPLWIEPVSKKQMHTTIEWPGIPSDAMEPINEAAREVFALFTTWIGGVKEVNERLRITPKGVVVVEGHMAGGQKERPQTSAGELTTDPRARGVKLTGRTMPGEVTQTSILGTVAAPARQQF